MGRLRQRGEFLFIFLLVMDCIPGTYPDFPANRVCPSDETDDRLEQISKCQPYVIAQLLSALIVRLHDLEPFPVLSLHVRGQHSMVLGVCPRQGQRVATDGWNKGLQSNKCCDIEIIAILSVRYDLRGML